MVNLFLVDPYASLLLYASMNSKDQQQLDQWVQDWQKTQAALETVHVMELQNFDYQQHIDLLNEMLTYACRQSHAQESTGLIEQQRIFMTMRQTNSTQRNG